ncbi:ATP23 [Acrasis kona]|uniref:Mitochondrial inner membrane protease ATP23 n=1 Tax=Acrasis kona TaxID=1008807 RepID=A0AAW2YIT5_9EUKA
MRSFKQEDLVDQIDKEYQQILKQTGTKVIWGKCSSDYHLGLYNSFLNEIKMCSGNNRSLYTAKSVLMHEIVHAHDHIILGANMRDKIQASCSEIKAYGLIDCGKFPSRIYDSQEECILTKLSFFPRGITKEQVLSLMSKCNSYARGKDITDNILIKLQS